MNFTVTIANKGILYLSKDIFTGHTLLKGNKCANSMEIFHSTVVCT